MSKIHFNNIELDDATHYFLYIGELKNHGLNEYLRETLNSATGQRYDFICIVPDIFEQYHYQNVMVINPMIESGACRFGTSDSCRISGKQFVEAVSGCEQVHALIETLRQRQPNVYIAMFESRPEMTLDTFAGVSLLGPASHVAHRLNSKVYQYTQLRDRLPVVDFGISAEHRQLIADLDACWDQWADGIFVTKEYSAAGINSILAHNTDTVAARFGDGEGPFLYSRYVPHTHDPTVLAVVANEQDVYVAGIADQRIEGSTRFTGSTYPSVLDPQICAQLKEYTRIAGRWMAKEGYRGIFGCDYLVTHDGAVRFLEINARKQGTTLEFCCTLEQLLPPGAPNLMDLEYHAVVHGKFPPGTTEIDTPGVDLHWGTYNYKLSQTVRTNGYIPHASHEREAFERVCRGSLKKDFLILEHIGSDFVVASGAFIARIVALGHDTRSVQEITPLSHNAFRNLSERVSAVLNQAVLLKGINDTRTKMWKLCETIQESYVRPYYIFNCSYRNPQFAHFRVPVDIGRDIVESMYGNISGDAIPRYIATAGGKIPLHRSNVEGTDNGSIRLKKPWSGETVSYPDADPQAYANPNFGFNKHQPTKHNDQLD